MKRIRKAVPAVIMLIIFGLFFCGCENKAEASLRQVKEELSELAPEDVKITLYFLYPYLYTRTPLTVDMLKSQQSEPDKDLDEYGIAPPLTVKEFSGDDAKDAVQVILEELDPSMMVPVEKAGYINARICFEITNAKGDLLLQIVFFADGTNGYSRNVYWNGIELNYHPAFYRIIEPCLQEVDDADGYFDQQGQVRGYGLPS